MFAPFDAVALNDEPSTIYALTEALRISYVNRAWSRFAQANGATWKDGEWGIGAPVMDAIPAVLQPFYERLFNTALKQREVVEHDYECPSATEFRQFRMRILPCASGLLVVHSLLRSELIAPEAPVMESLYRRHDGLVLQCSHCRRVRRADLPQWDWVPSHVERPTVPTSHGLCMICSDYYYPRSKAEP